MPQINDLTLAEALAAAHCLHDRLRFEAIELDSSRGSAGFDVAPMAIPGDIAEVCESFPSLADGALAAICARCQVKACRSALAMGGCNTMFVAIATRQEAETLAGCLNRLYGIP